jgi:hypothetical protein
MAVLRVERLPLGPEYRGVRGILGENFLQHFDILIDNQHRKMTLDAGSALAESLGGEHLPITFPPSDGDEIKYRPMVLVTVPDFSPRPVRVLLDSGADTFLLVGSGTSQATTLANAVRVKTVNGSRSCISSENRLRWGKATLSDLAMVTCQSATANSRDYQGNLPTSIFQRIFISHAGCYVIVEPSRHAPAPQEIAVVTPPAR